MAGLLHFVRNDELFKGLYSRNQIQHSMHCTTKLTHKEEAIEEDIPFIPSPIVFANEVKQSSYNSVLVWIVSLRSQRRFRGIFCPQFCFAKQN
jgi:hypothetical protein